MMDQKNYLIFQLLLLKLILQLRQYLQNLQNSQNLHNLFIVQKWQESMKKTV